MNCARLLRSLALDSLRCRFCNYVCRWRNSTTSTAKNRPYCSSSTTKTCISALASAQGLITHTTSRRDSQRHIYENSVSPCETVRTTRCFFREDNSAISLLIELKLLGMVDFTIADGCQILCPMLVLYRHNAEISKNYLNSQKFERPKI